MKSQHKNAHGVLPTHVRFTERRLEVACTEANNRLTPAFLRLTAHLDRDPEPRFMWTNRRRGSNALACPSMNAVHAAQIAMVAAIRSGDARVIEETALEIQSYGAEILNAMLAPYHAHVNGEPSVIADGLSAHKEITEASQAIATALVTRSPGDLDRAVKEATEGEVALNRWATAARRAATPPKSIHALR